MSQFKKWVLRNFTVSELRDLVNHGAICGFSGLTYYSDTQKLYKKHCDEIWDMLYESAENFGTSIIEMIAGFQGAKDIQSACAFENLLVWFAAEQIAYERVELGIK